MHKPENERLARTGDAQKFYYRYKDYIFKRPVQGKSNIRLNPNGMIVQGEKANLKNSVALTCELFKNGKQWWGCHRIGNGLQRAQILDMYRVASIASKGDQNIFLVLLGTQFQTYRKDFLELESSKLKIFFSDQKFKEWLIS